MKAARVTVHIDVANARDVDITKTMERVRGLGKVGCHAYAYGDWAGEPEALAKAMLAQGVELVHCPTWRNGGADDQGTPTVKRTDDVLMHRGVYRALIDHPSIRLLVIVGTDTDILPCAVMARSMGKQVVIFHHPSRRGLGHVLEMAGFTLEPYPVRQAPCATSLSGAALAVLRTVIHLQQSSQGLYLTRTLILRYRGQMDSTEVPNAVRELVSKGVLGEYNHHERSTGALIPALRIQWDHPLVQQVLNEDSHAIQAGMVAGGLGTAA